MTDRTPGRCRACGEELGEVFADLGTSPLANALLGEEQLSGAEHFYPLRAMVCARCLLVQLEEFEAPEQIFSEYPYFSSFSTTWVRHCTEFATRCTRQLALSENSWVVEVASNDGCLLEQFVERGIPVMGIEPAENVARSAIERGIPTQVAFFGLRLAQELADQRRADLIVGNNVLAHVPDLHDFVAGLACFLAPEGTITLEFPHLLRMIDKRQFDTIYHEHFSYFSLIALEPVLGEHGLSIVDVEELSTHGGSLRVWLRHTTGAGEHASSHAQEVMLNERRHGLHRIDTYRRFAEQLPVEKRRLVRVLIDLRDSGLRIVGYGAPAKATTLLNFCGIGPDLIDFTVDRNPWKQGRFIPGVRVPIRPVEEIERSKPDVVFVLPWNLEAEVLESMASVRDWGGRFLVRRPDPMLLT